MSRYTKEIGTVNKVLLVIELLPVCILFFLSLLLLGSSSFWFTPLLIVSILSMVAVVYIIMQTLSGKREVARRFIYLAHSGLVVTFIGVLALIIDGDGSIKSHSPVPPPAMFSFGLVVLVPYLHVMILNKFFTKP